MNKNNNSFPTSSFNFYIALYKPQIPPNTGNIARLCVCIDVPLLIIGKPAFKIDEPAASRAGLDHWNDLHLLCFSSWKEFYKQFYSNNPFRIVIVSKSGKTNFWDFAFQKNDILVFGNETRGIPPKLMKLFPHSIRIPMWGPTRSINLSNSVSIVAYECIRQQYPNKKIPENISPRKYYRKHQ